MRKIAWLLGVAVLAGASMVSAKPPAPGGNCPPDVGAALAAACPCDASSGGQAWKNHGGYVSCVVHFRNDLRKAGCLDDTSKRTIASCAARSTCGKPGAVLCCHYDTSGTCVGDPTPGDGTKAGTCSNDATILCDVDTDCITVTSGPSVKRSADLCIAKGGTPVGSGSKCSACPLPPPSPVPSPGPTP